MNSLIRGANLSLLVTVLALVSGSALEESPVGRVVELIKNLKSEVLADGKEEQEGYDKYACWCEKTLQRKASDISNEKEVIAETNTLIKKLKSEIASHGAEIAQLEKDIAQNHQAQGDATGVRDKEYSDYNGEKTESEQCIGALEAAINVLNGAGTKKGFLQTVKSAQMLSVVAGVRDALKHRVVSEHISAADMDTMQKFVVSTETGFVQTGNNPFGDYAPQSTQIQGILKGMYDAFTADLEKDNAAEAESQKSFEELMATKAKELATLESTLEKQETDKASKEKALAEAGALLDDTTADLNADEAFFADTTDACETKAKEWSVRVRLRTEELAGMEQAIEILTDPKAKAHFKEAAETFLQVRSIQTHTSAESTSVIRGKAYESLRNAAANSKNRGLAAIAVELKSGGHFDKVIAMIDEMMVVLRKEEEDDIAHRDRCENEMNGNQNEMEDLQNAASKAKSQIKRLDNTKKDVEGEIRQVKKDIAATESDLATLLKFRNQESKDFIKALHEDTEAAALIRSAIGALAKFYKNNKISMAQQTGKGPSYTEDEDKAPETSWSGSDYGGRKSENTGIVAIMEMLVEDLEKEIADGRADDAAAQDKYMKQRGALEATKKAQEDTKVSLETEKADLEAKIDDTEGVLGAKNADLKGEKATAGALGKGCAWVKSHFADRRAQRKSEMDGLVEAKSFLSGSI